MGIAKIKKIQNSRHGMTLLEVVLVMAIVGLLAIILANILITHGRLFRGESSEVELQLEGSRLTESITTSARVADRVVSSQTINGVAYTTDFDTVIFSIPSIDSQGTISGTFDHIVFYIDPSDPTLFKLSQEADPASDRTSFEKLLSDSVAQLNFFYDDSDYSNVDNVSLDARLTETVLDVTHEVTVNTRFNLGNR